jgi:hypothetical protein
MLQYKDGLFSFIQQCAQISKPKARNESEDIDKLDSNILLKTVTLLGCVSEFFKTDLKETLSAEWVKDLLHGDIATGARNDDVYVAVQYTNSVVSNILRPESIEWETRGQLPPSALQPSMFTHHDPFPLGGPGITSNGEHSVPSPLYSPTSLAYTPSSPAYTPSSPAYTPSSPTYVIL